jgi:cytochrome c-type biogenesis protein CcmH
MADDEKPAARTRLPAILLGFAALGAAASVGVRAWLDHRPDAPVAASAAPTPPMPLTALEAHLRAAPGDGEGWRTLGAGYFHAERYADAAGAYAQATRLLPGRADIWSALGEAQTLSVNAVDGIAHAAFAHAIAIDPRDARARYFLAVEKDVAGDHRGAIDGWIALLDDAPPGAVWAQPVRDLIQQVATRARIDIAGRLPPAAPAVPAGREVAAAGIPGPTPEDMNAASALTPSQQQEMARGMIATLAGRLRQNPDDADGWIRLMRGQMVLGDGAAAHGALIDARRAFANDPASLARLTDAANVLGVPAT